MHDQQGRERVCTRGPSCDGVRPLRMAVGSQAGGPCDGVSKALTGSLLWIWFTSAPHSNCSTHVDRRRAGVRSSSGGGRASPAQAKEARERSWHPAAAPPPHRSNVHRQQRLRLLQPKQHDVAVLLIGLDPVTRDHSGAQSAPAPCPGPSLCLAPAARPVDAATDLKSCHPAWLRASDRVS